VTSQIFKGGGEEFDGQLSNLSGMLSFLVDANSKSTPEEADALFYRFSTCIFRFLHLNMKNNPSRNEILSVHKEWIDRLIFPLFCHSISNLGAFEEPYIFCPEFDSNTKEAVLKNHPLESKLIEPLMLFHDVNAPVNPERKLINIQHLDPEEVFFEFTISSEFENYPIF